MRVTTPLRTGRLMEVFAIVGSLAEVVKEDDLAKTHPPTHLVDDERVAVRQGVVATTPVVDVVALDDGSYASRFSIEMQEPHHSPMQSLQSLRPSGTRRCRRSRGGGCSLRGAAGASCCGPSG